MRNVIDDFLHDWREVALLSALTAVPIAAVLGLVPAARDHHTAPLVAAEVSGLMLVLAAFLGYLHWREHPTIAHGWAVAASAMIVVQLVSGSGFALAGSRSPSDVAWGAYVDAACAVIALGLVVLGSRADDVPDPLLLGIGLGVVHTGIQALGTMVAPAPSEAVVVGSAATMGAAYLGLAVVLLRARTLPRWAAEHLAVAVTLVGVGEAARLSTDETGLSGMVAAVALVLAATLWTSATYVMLREGHDDHRGRQAALEETLIVSDAEVRAGREQLHEVRNTLAGLTSASRLLLETPSGSTARTDLEGAVHAELCRLERLLGQRSEPSCVSADVDEALRVLLRVHRARGKDVDWTPSGARVRSDPDDLTEVLNILLDNAAKHGSGAPSRVEATVLGDVVEIAVSDDGPGIPAELRSRVFDWGTRSGPAAGEGIGLHLAGRLLSRHGGTLGFVDTNRPGCTFVVRLPVARESAGAAGASS